MAANPVLRTYNVAQPTAIGPQAPVNLDWLPFAAVTFGIFVVSGVATYSLEFTLDYLNLDNDQANPNVRWFTLEDLPVGTVGTKYTAIYYPLQAARLNIAAITGTVEFKVLQSSTGRY